MNAFIRNSLDDANAIYVIISVSRISQRQSVLTERLGVMVHCEDRPRFYTYNEQVVYIYTY